MHPHDVFLRLVVVDYVRALDDAVRAQVAGGLEGEEFGDEGPGYEILFVGGLG